jgi:hypothetical protein
MGFAFMTTIPISEYPTKRGRVVARVVPENAPKPWLALRGRGEFQGDPFEPVVSKSEIKALK